MSDKPLEYDTDGHVLFRQDADDVEDYRFVWASYLQGQAISSSVFEAEGSAVTIGDGTNGADAPSYTNKSDHNARANSTYYAKGAGMVPVVDNGFSYENMRAGFSAASAPASSTFATIEGETFQDGDCLWKCWRNFCYSTVWVVGSTSSTGLVTNRVYGNSPLKKDRSMRIKITPAKGV